jgi:hypothetical protein
LRTCTWRPKLQKDSGFDDTKGQNSKIPDFAVPLRPLQGVYRISPAHGKF